MAAKKTAKKVAKKATARKTAKKTVNTESTDDQVKSPRSKSGAKAVATANLWEAAYYRYLDRLKKGLSGNELGDWLAAESESHK